MLRFHTLVLTSDNSIKQGLRRLGVAISSHMEFLDSTAAIALPAALSDSRGGAAAHPIDLLIIDLRDPRLHDAQGVKLDEIHQALPKLARVIYLVEDNQLVERLELFKRESTASVLCQRGQLDEEELIATATKLLRGELFGLQKYLPWGVTTFTIEVHSYEEKDQALRVMIDSAALAGWRGPLRERIELVCDELMMNALYHAPVDANGGRKNEGRATKDLVGQTLSAISVQYGSSGRYFGVAVRDSFGSLTRQGMLEYLGRARTMPAQIEDKASGAGLGLVMVLRSASKLVFNLAPGNASEVIALFDRELLAKGQAGARSLHVFLAPAIAREAPREERSVAQSGPTAAEESRAARSGAPSARSAPPSSSTTLSPPEEGRLASRGWLVPLLILAALISGLVVVQMMGGGKRSRGAAPTAAALEQAA